MDDARQIQPDLYDKNDNKIIWAYSPSYPPDDALQHLYHFLFIFVPHCGAYEDHGFRGVESVIERVLGYDGSHWHPGGFILIFMDLLLAPLPACRQAVT